MYSNKRNKRIAVQVFTAPEGCTSIVINGRVYYLNHTIMVMENENFNILSKEFKRKEHGRRKFKLG